MLYVTRDAGDRVVIWEGKPETFFEDINGQSYKFFRATEETKIFSVMESKNFPEVNTENSPQNLLTSQAFFDAMRQTLINMEAQIVD